MGKINRGMARIAQEFMHQPLDQMILVDEYPYVQSVQNGIAGWVDIEEIVDCVSGRGSMPPIHTSIMQWAVDCFGYVDRRKKSCYAVHESRGGRNGI